MSDHSYTPGEAPPDPLVGATVADRYLVEKKLGEGGMGAVYLARHVVLEKQVALKILHGEFSGRKDLAERFLHEAKAAARIRHEHVIDITDFGQTHTGNPFFCMEVLAGHDLAHEVRESGPPEWARIKSIFLQTCSALQAAHEKNIIHRDLKPENIFLIQRSGQPDFVKVLDFGIAKLTDLEETGKRLTKTGMVFGTPEYMSPEQARGDKTDHRVDVYAMGCILYQLVCGDVPFRAESFMGVLTRHLFEPVPPMATQTTRQDLPAGLEAVVMRALEKDRDKRYKDMNELAYAVEALDVVPGVAYYPPGATRPTTATGAVAALQTPVPKTPPGGVPSTADAATRVPAQGTPVPASPWAEGPVQKGQVKTVAGTAESAAYTQPIARKKGPPWLWIALGLAVAGGSAGAVLAMSGKPAAAVVTPDAAPVAGTTPDAAPVVAAPTPDAAVAVAVPPVEPVEPTGPGKKPRDKKPKPGEKTPGTPGTTTTVTPTPGGGEQKPPDPTPPGGEKPPDPTPTEKPPEEKKPPEGEKPPEEKKPGEIKNPFGTN